MRKAYNTRRDSENNTMTSTIIDQSKLNEFMGKIFLIEREESFMDNTWGESYKWAIDKRLNDNATVIGKWSILLLLLSPLSN